MLLHLCTWTEVEAYLKQSSGIILPIGSTEQHGPTGLIGTDAICAEAIARGVGEATNALVGPTINVGMALHHTGFPGTISLQPSTLILLIRDYLTSLTRTGFTKFFFINGHGGNIATLKAAFAETYAHLADLNIPHASQVHLPVRPVHPHRRVRHHPGRARGGPHRAGRQHPAAGRRAGAAVGARLSTAGKPPDPHALPGNAPQDRPVGRSGASS